MGLSTQIQCVLPIHTKMSRTSCVLPNVLKIQGAVSSVDQKWDHNTYIKIWPEESTEFELGI